MGVPKKFSEYRFVKYLQVTSSDLQLPQKLFFQRRQLFMAYLKNNVLIKKNDKCFTNIWRKISNTEFPLSCCLELLVIYKKSMLVSFCGKVLPGSKTKNDNSPQTRSTKYSKDSSGLPS